MIAWFQKIISREILLLLKDTGSIIKCVYNVYCFSYKIFFEFFIQSRMYMVSGGGLGGEGEAFLQPNCNVQTPKASPSLTVLMTLV